MPPAQESHYLILISETEGCRCILLYFNLNKYNVPAGGFFSEGVVGGSKVIWFIDQKVKWEIYFNLNLFAH